MPALFLCLIMLQYPPMTKTQELLVIGGGLAGTEAAWQAAELGLQVTCTRCAPNATPPPMSPTNWRNWSVAIRSARWALPKAPGLLKAEMRGLGSFILACATATAVPAGSSLSVDREGFSELVTAKSPQHPNIEVVREEVTRARHPLHYRHRPAHFPCAGGSIGRLSGRNTSTFTMPSPPLSRHDSIDMSIAFRKSRYDEGEQDDGDYINCAMTQEEYGRFYEALTTAETASLRDFETEDAQFFEGCMPVEVLAKRGLDALRFGPLRPVGLIDPRTGKRPFAVVQLRQDNLAGTLYNLVGFQTNLRWGQQEEVLRLIPGLATAEFVRMGQLHRNTYINSPELLHPTMQYRGRADLFFAGQITGVEGYAAMRPRACWRASTPPACSRANIPLILPPHTMLGALAHYVTHAEAKHFQPMKANFGLFPTPEKNMSKGDRYQYYSERSLTSLRRFARERRLKYDRVAAETAELAAAV
jgi:methylenetetrahydrofolate--tRNA-(uracil-5-)-methyltransferase